MARKTPAKAIFIPVEMLERLRSRKAIEGRQEDLTNYIKNILSSFLHTNAMVTQPEAIVPPLPNPLPKPLPHDLGQKKKNRKRRHRSNK